ncbi:hypothetical protein [Saccharopolyspora sp. NFXS83]|uniref:hypothetical protein n=1 Tax=Saccharopolyspora sp. NFXS83 TaxID=2993560 RepID=UPI002B052B33|nr:hypothetical protein [Saccharopolyspora sp. NFXS83]
MEITDVNGAHSARGAAELVDLGRGFARSDVGTHESSTGAGQYAQVVERQQGVRIACLEEIALRTGSSTGTPATAWVSGRRTRGAGGTSWRSPRPGSRCAP